jgi:hypothetical protein
MKKTNIFLVVSVLALSIQAQDSNKVSEVAQPLKYDAVNQQTNQHRSRREKKDNSEQGKIRDQRYAKQLRRLQLMERELKKIGVTEEEKAQINALQKLHKEKMMANAQQSATARKKLSKLQDEGASMEVLESAIQEISAAQAEQLRILVRNRMAMERILGKEKFAKFMQNARAQFEKHGRRGGSSLPPRPGVPPTPGQQREPPTLPPTPTVPPAN